MYVVLAGVRINGSGGLAAITNGALEAATVCTPSLATTRRMALPLPPSAAVSIAALSRVLPLMRAQLERLLSGPNSAVKAATAIRVAVSHYIVRSDDDDQFLAQLRNALGLKI